MRGAGTKLKLTELPNASPELPALYIFCDFQGTAGLKAGHAARSMHMLAVKEKFNRHLPNHVILVGDVDLKFSYITPQEAFYHELKQDHRSKE